MATELIMPKLTQTMDEGKLINWLKQEGQRVEKGEPLFIVETDKAAVEVEAPATGILARVLVEPGATLSVGAIIGYVAEPGEPLPEIPPTVSTVAVPATAARAAPGLSEAPSSGSEVEVKASPLARRLAQQHGIDLEKVRGSGPEGRIVKEDILAIVSGREKSPETPRPEAGMPATADEMPVRAGGLVVLRGMRKAIAEQMTYSARTAPHVTITMEVDMTDAVTMREHLLAEVERTANIRLSLNHLVLKAVATALKEHPMLNSRWTDEGVQLVDEVNLGVAVAVDDGLVVPVLRNAHSRSLVDIASQAVHLAERAKEHKLSQGEFSGSTFTVSNLGMFGVEVFTPIINPPETAILGVGQCVRKPVVINEELALRWIMVLSLSFDHRVVDGAQAARFLSAVKVLLERPAVLALHK